MIVAEQKSLEDIHKMLKGAKKVLAVGCGTCVTVCFAGGRQEVATLAASLRMKSKIEGEPVEVDETFVQRQCEHEFIDPLGDKIGDYDAVVSLGCGVGVQAMAERFPKTRFYPALNTAFMGMPTEQGVWEELCQACGSCILDITGGVCPVTRCAKQLFNGPCGGSQDGHCEIDPSIPCAWHKIWERAEELGMIDDLMAMQPPKDWSTSRDHGPRRIVREDLKIPTEDEAGEAEAQE